MYPGAEALVEVVSSIATERSVAEAIVRKTTVDQTAGTALVAAEDARAQLANPDFIAEREIDLAKAAILGNLKGLLPNENLAAIEDATRLGTGVVLAQAMAVQDAAAFRLWASEAMIESAYVKEIVADKIRAGILQAAISISSGGSISAGGASLDQDGLELLETASELSAPSTDRASKITPRSPSPWAHYQFYRVPGVGWGTQIAAEGSGAGGGVIGNPGQVRLDASAGAGVSAARQARVVVQGGDTGDLLDTFVSAGPHLRVADRLEVGGQAGFGGLISAAGSISAGGTIAGLQLEAGAGGVVSSDYNAGGLNAVFGGDLQGGVLAARGALTAGGNITASGTLIAGSVRPQYAFGASTAGDWYSVAPNGGVRHFTFTAVPHWYRVLWNTAAGYNGARPLAESTVLTSAIDVTNSRITITNNWNQTVYVNCAAWVFS